MKDLKNLGDLLGMDDNTEEVYTSDQKKRAWRGNRGLYSRQKGLFNFLILIRNWESIVGKLMAENTIPLKVRGQTLIISAKHSIFAQELGFLAPKIIEKINTEYPETLDKIKSIKFVHSDFGHKDFVSPKNFKEKKQEKPKLHPFSPEYQIRKKKAESLFQDIEDNEIKEMLIQFYLL